MQKLLLLKFFNTEEKEEVFSFNYKERVENIT